MKLSGSCFSSSLWALVLLAQQHLLLLLLSGSTRAAGASNDACLQASIIPRIPFQVKVNTSLNETHTTIHHGLNGTRGVWLKFTPNKDRIVDMSLTERDSSSKIVVHMGSSCAPMARIQETNGYGFMDQTLSFPMYHGNSYYILVVGSGVNDFGTATLSISSPGSVANDVCSSAINLPSIPATLYANNTAAVPHFSDASCGVRSNARGVWYKYVATYDAFLKLKMVQIDLSPHVVIYEGSCKSLTCIRRPFSADHGKVQFPTYTEKTYYILIVGGSEEDYGTVKLTLTSVENVGNDECAGAITVHSLPFEATPGNTTSAIPYAVTFEDGGVYITNRMSRWYRYTPTENHRMQLSVSDPNATSFLFPSVNIFSGTNCNDITERIHYGVFSYGYYPAPCVSVSQCVQLVVFAGVTYYVLIPSGFYPEGEYESTTLSIQKLDDLENDVCTSATNIQSLPFQTRFNTAEMVAGFTFFDEPCNTNDYTRGVWYQYTATEDSSVSVRVYNQNFLNAKAVVFQGSCDSLTCLQVEDSFFSLCDVNMQFNAYNGVPYYIFVVGNRPEDVGEAIISIESPAGEVSSLTGVPVPDSEVMGSSTHNASLLPASEH